MFIFVFSAYNSTNGSIKKEVTPVPVSGTWVVHAFYLLLLAQRPPYLLGYSADYSSSVAIKALHGPVVLVLALSSLLAFNLKSHWHYVFKHSREINSRVPNHFVFALLEKMSFLINMVCYPPPATRHPPPATRGKVLPDKKTKCSVQVLWAIVNMSCKFGCTTTNLGDTALI